MRNAAALLEFGDTFGLRSLRAAALNLALRDFGAFVASDGFAGLPPHECVHPQVSWQAKLST